MTNKFKKGDPVYFPTYVELKLLGWKDNTGNYGLLHDDCNSKSFIIHKKMYILGGRIVTVDVPVSEYTEGLYHVKEDKNSWSWPLDILNEQWINYNKSSSHIHEEGMTPIDGWFICKTCGTNLKEIK